MHKKKESFLGSLSIAVFLTPLGIVIALSGCATPIGTSQPTSTLSAAAQGVATTAQSSASAVQALPTPATPIANSTTEAQGAARVLAPKSSAANKSGATPSLFSEPNRSLFIGTGDLVKPTQPKALTQGGDIRFNFENTDVRDAVRQVMTDMLGENYIVDPAVTGSITLRMNKPVSRADLIPLLEIMLRQANSILVKDGAIWRVQPTAAGVRGVGKPGFLTRPAGGGYGITIVPLRWIGVNEMMRLLDAIVKEPSGQGGAGGSVRPEPLRNMLIVAGTPNETQYILDTIEMFDVDWMNGMSAGLFTLEHSEAKKVLEEVDKVLGGLGAGGPPVQGAAAGAGLGPLFGLVRVQLIERLNAILVISPRPEMIAQAETWIRRLDRGGSGDSTRFYVYNLQYTSAEKLAPILQAAMQGRAGATTIPAAQTAPGQNPFSIATPVAIQNQPTSPVPAVPQRVAPIASGAVGAGQGSAIARNATITADKDRNALLIVASPAEYGAIEAAIKKLDILPRQVMVEVTILEVDLTDDFALGVEWAATRSAEGATPVKYAGSEAQLGAAGLAFSLKNKTLAGNILNILDAKLNANDGNKRVRINASPKLMAVDNTPVTFNVGRSVSVQTGAVTTPGTTSTNNSTSSTFQYLQTGISVSITPRISAGGLVNLEITQEISEPTASTIAGNTNPDISKTALKNTVLAQDGETIVMAGLIREKITDSTNGLPGVSRLPFLGSLFGKQVLNVDKQELLVLVRPVVVNSIEQGRDAGEEIRNKMRLLKDAFIEANVPLSKSAPQVLVPQGQEPSRLRISSNLGDNPEKK